VGWKGAIYESSRGGRATYHGPNQVVVYPILDLKKAHRGFKARDVHAYLRALESATVSVIREVGLTSAEARTSKIGEISLTGVWVGERKLASIGIAVRKWITYHGVAINVLNDPSAFVGINPCGFAPSVMSSVERELGCNIDKSDFTEICKNVFSSSLT
jgi:lipoyl(octanoyl) transferase